MDIVQPLSDIVRIRHIKKQTVPDMNTERHDRGMYINPYTVGAWYDGKGTYLGMNKKGHMFQKHKSVNRTRYGPKYYFEAL